MSEENKDQIVNQEEFNDAKVVDTTSQKEANIKQNKLLFIIFGVLFVVVLAFSVYFFVNSRASQGEDLPEDSPAVANSDSAATDAVKADLASMGWADTEQDFYSSGDEFDLLVYVDSKGKELGAFSFDLDFDENMVEVIADKGSDGLSKGVDAGNYLIMANPNDIGNGFYKFSGICAQDCANGNELAVAVVHMKSLADTDISKLDYELRLTEISDVMGKKIN